MIVENVSVVGSASVSLGNGLRVCLRMTNHEMLQKWYRAASQVEVKEQCFKKLFNIVENQIYFFLTLMSVLYNDVQGQ